MSKEFPKQFLILLAFIATCLSASWITDFEGQIYHSFALFNLGFLLLINILDGSMNEHFWSVIGQTFFELWKLLNRPLIRHYEAREENYKQIIKRLEVQLSQSKGDSFNFTDIDHLQHLVNVSGTNWIPEYLRNAQSILNDRNDQLLPSPALRKDLSQIRKHTNV